MGREPADQMSAGGGGAEFRKLSIVPWQDQQQSHRGLDGVKTFFQE